MYSQCCQNDDHTSCTASVARITSISLAYLVFPELRSYLLYSQCSQNYDLTSVTASIARNTTIPLYSQYCQKDANTSCIASITRYKTWPYKWLNLLCCQYYQKRSLPSIMTVLPDKCGQPIASDIKQIMSTLQPLLPHKLPHHLSY